MSNSLLKLKPDLINLITTITMTKVPVGQVKKQSPASLKSSLYTLLDSMPLSLATEDKKPVVMVQNEEGNEFIVEKYERYKAGLMGRVWLRKKLADSQFTSPFLVTDLDALGLKWKHELNTK